MTSSSGRQAAREARWKRAVADQFEAILARIEEGATLDQACRHLQRGQNLNSVRRWLRLNPNENERIRAIRVRLYGSARGNGKRIPASHWEAGLHFIATTDEQNLSTVRRQGIPHIDEMRRRAGRDPTFAERLNHAFAQRNARADIKPSRHGEASYREAIAYLKANSGKRLIDLSHELKARKLPPLGAIYSQRRAWPWLAADYAEITAARGVKRYDEAAQAEALGILQSDPARARQLLKREAGRLPSFNALTSRAKHNVAFADAFFATRGLRREDYAARSQERRARRAANRPARAKGNNQYQSNVLRSGLLLDDLYREVSEAFHSRLEPHLRDDMISEVVLAVLEGRMAREDVRSKAKAFGWKFANRMVNKRTDTLDRPIASDYGDVMVVDTLSSCEWSFEGAI